MSENYPIILEGTHIGEANVSKQGLYYHFHCICRLPKDTLYRAFVSCADKRECLGVLVPDGTGYVAKSKIPVSRLGIGQMEFYVTRNKKQSDIQFIPISPDEPCEFLSCLDNMYLGKSGTCVGLYKTEGKTQSSTME